MAFRSSASGSSTGSSSVSLTWPTVAAHDRAYVAITRDDTTVTWTTIPSGFTQLENHDVGSPDGGNHSLFEAKDLVGTETGALTFDAAGKGGDAVIAIVVLSGRDNAAAATFETPTYNTSSNATPITMGATSGTAVAGDDLVAFFVLDQTSGSDVWGFTPPSGFTEREDAHSTQWCAIEAATKDAQGAGAVGTVSGTATRASGSGNAGWGAFIIAVPAGAGGGSSAPPGTALETDTALALSAAHRAVPGIATETDTSLALSSKHQAVFGNAIEFVQAFALASSHVAVLGLATETDTARALGNANAPGIGIETDTALALSASHRAVPGVATETDTSLALSASHRAVPGVATETDTAFALQAPASGPGIATETDTSLALSASHRAVPGIATETDAALGLTSVHAATPGVALETDTAFALVSVHRAVPGVATETDAALAPAAASPPGVSTETDAAFALVSVHQAVPGIALETDAAFAVSVAPPGIALEIDTALAPSASRPSSGPRNRTVYEPNRARVVLRNGMSLSPKHHLGVDWFFFPFVLLPNDTIETFGGITQDAGDCVLHDVGIVGNQASCRASGGTPGSAVVLRAECTTTLGETRELIGTFIIT